MGRKNVEAEDFQMDPLDQACLALNISEENCAILREAAEQLCKEKREKGKREPSEYNIFIGKCVKEKEGPIKERFKECVETWKKQKKK
jgi:hypothetical protein